MAVARFVHTRMTRRIDPHGPETSKPSKVKKQIEVSYFLHFGREGSAAAAILSPTPFRRSLISQSTVLIIYGTPLELCARLYNVDIFSYCIKLLKESRVIEFSVRKH